MIKRYPVLKILICYLFLNFNTAAYGDEIYLKNGDRITGEVLQDAGSALEVKTEAMGKVLVSKDLIEKVEGKYKEIAQSGTGPVSGTDGTDKAETVWQREASVGYNLTKGNTKSEELSGSFLINRNRVHVDEITLKGDGFYSTADGQMNAQRWYVMPRYAFNFDGNKKWYNFYKVETDHDRFANIDYRVIPSVGLGYWFFDMEDIKLLAEAGLGLEHTNYLVDEKTTNEAILVSRLFFEKRLFRDVMFTQDIYFYPGIKDFSVYRIHSESSLTVPLYDMVSLRMQLVEDYNSTPPEDTKKEDRRILSSLVISY